MRWWLLPFELPRVVENRYCGEDGVGVGDGDGDGDGDGYGDDDDDDDDDEFWM